MRVAVINTHPIQHFAPLWREIAKSDEVQLKILYCSDLGVNEYVDRDFNSSFKWDVDLIGGYDSEFLPIRARPRKLGFWETDNPQVSEALSRFGADVVVLFGYSHLTDLRALRWAKRHRARVLVFSDSELKHSRSLWRRAAKQLAVRFFLSQMDGVLPIGNCNAAYYRHYGVPAKAMYWCAYPVDGIRLLSSVGSPEESRASLRAALGIGDDDFVFACVGKFIARKRPGDVIQAWLRLPEPVREQSWVVLVGEGPLRQELEELLRATKSRVILTGFVNQSRIAAHFAACDALVVASETDAHPLVVTESLFFGRPVIASNAIGCIGSEDTVREGENALVYPCGDIGALSAAMARLFNEPATCRRFGQRSREIASGQDVAAVAPCFIEAFKKVTRIEKTGTSESSQRFESL